MRTPLVILSTVLLITLAVTGGLLLQQRHPFTMVLFGLLALSLLLHYFVTRSVSGSESKFRALIEHSPLAKLIIDEAGRIRIVNRQAETLFATGRTELLGSSVNQWIPGFSTANCRENLEPGRTELTARSATGRSFPAEITVSPLQSVGEKLMTIAIADITERRTLEDELRRLNRDLQAEVERQTARVTELFERISDGFLALDTAWRFVYINKNAEQIIGDTRENLQGQSVIARYGEDHPFVQACRRAVETGRPIELELQQAATGKWFQDHIYPSPNGVSVYFHEITYRKLAEEAMRKREAEMQELSAYLLNVREEERTHIAREIHDDLGQQLTSLKMDVQWLRRQGPEPVSAKAEQMSALIDQAIQSLRRISSNLRPSVLDDLGLEAGLEWLCLELQKRTSTQIRFHSTLGDPALPPETCTHLFRIAQEALNNAVKYAEARHITVELTAENQHLVLRIGDDGKGFDASIPEGRQKTFGLLGMRERATMAGGTFQLETAPGAGTRITVTLPNLLHEEIPDS